MVQPQRPHRGPIRPWAAVVVFIILAYAPTLSGGFLLDDHSLVEKNPFLKELKPVADYFLLEDGVDRSQWGESYHTGYYRPLVSLSYALDHWLWGNRPAGFRATNLAMHMATCLVLLGLVRRHGRRGWGGTAAVLLFALHPVNTEAVAWISSRNNVLATLFSLLALSAYTATDGRHGAKRLLAPLWFALALFSKEFGVMLLPILFVWNRTLGEKRRSPVAEIVGYLPFAGVLLIYFGLRTAVIGAALSPHGVDGLLWRLFLAPYLALADLSLVLFPVRLHSFSMVYPQGASALLAAAAGLVGLALVGGFLWRCRRNKEVVFGAAAFGLGLLPVLNIVPTSAVSLVSMRWLYFPAAFLAYAAVRPMGFLLNRRIGGWIGAAILTGLAGTTFFLNLVHWRNEAAFYRREVTVFGNSDYAGGLAEVLHGRGELADAERYYREGLAARPNLVENHINYAALLIDTGRPKAALAALDRIAGAAMSRENRGRLANNRALALARLERLSEAVPLFEKAVALAPGEPMFWANLASAHAMTGRFSRAVGVLEEGLATHPVSAELLAGLARVRLDQGDAAAAARAFAQLPMPEQRTRADLAARIRQAGAAGDSRTDR